PLTPHDSDASATPSKVTKVCSGVPKDDFFQCGSTATQGTFSSRQRESGIKPLPERRRNNRIVTLMVECGSTQTLSSLRCLPMVAYQHERPTEHCLLDIG